MKNIKLILKGLLFYATLLLAVFTICGIDSLYNKDYFFPLIGIVIALLYTCRKVITLKDIDTFSGKDLF